MSVATIGVQSMTEIQTRQAVDHYLANVLGSAYTSSIATHQPGRWSFLICYQNSVLPQPCMVGRLLVNVSGASGHNGASDMIIPLTAEQLQEIRETAAWEVARQRGELARNEEGYVSRHQARRLARRWLDQELSMKFGASGGLWFPLHPPVWQFAIYFSVQAVHLEPLGVIDVNAQTGVVTPLSPEQLDNLRERVRAVIQPHPQTAAV